MSECAAVAVVVREAVFEKPYLISEGYMLNRHIRRDSTSRPPFPMDSTTKNPDQSKVKWRHKEIIPELHISRYQKKIRTLYWVIFLCEQIRYPPGMQHTTRELYIKIRLQVLFPYS